MHRCFVRPVRDSHNTPQIILHILLNHTKLQFFHIHFLHGLSVPPCFRFIFVNFSFWDNNFIFLSFIAHVSPNLQLPDLLPNHVRPQLPRRRVWSSQTPPTSPSCSFHHLSRTFSEVFDAANNGQPMGPYGDDEVFCPPGAVNAPVAIRSSLPPRQRRRRIRTNSLRETRRRSARSKSDDCPDESAKRDAESNVSPEPDSLDVYFRFYSRPWMKMYTCYCLNYINICLVEYLNINALTF